MTLTGIIPKTKSKVNLDPESLAEARDYIARYWLKLERYNPDDGDTLLGLPHPYLIPSTDTSAEFKFNEQYYWDSYFMAQGLLDTAHKDILEGMLDNLIFMQQRFGIIPNASRTYFTGRSQPPLLTSYIFDLYNLGGFSTEWLADRMTHAEHEYWQVWMCEEAPNWRLVHRGLSRYYDINVIHDLAEAESGWDMTTRFGHKCLNFLPVDLNALLYKYETDFAKTSKLVGDKIQAAKWRDRAEKRQAAMHELMWDRVRGFYYDYNYKKGRLGRVSSLAGYYPMWAGLASEKQAAKMVKSLKRFEQPGGLSTTSQALPNITNDQPSQWAYPNGWAPLHFIVVEGLKRYGYEDEARKIALLWVKTNLVWFEKHHEFLEKYNVVHPKKLPVEGLYPSQTGFGWTNAIFERFCRDWL